MPKKISKSSRNKAFGTIIVGVFLFSTVISMFIFPTPKEVAAESTPFIRVKNGNFEFLDSKGYNFKFNLDINNIKLVESRQEVGLSNIVVESDNAFGNTSLIFDKLDNGEVKFSINHQGNLYRDYSVKITVLKHDVQLFENYNQLRWDSGFFDYSDMMNIPEGVFWNTRDSNNYHAFWVRFDRTVDFYIDPVLSPQIALDFPTIEESANKTDQFTGSYQPLFADDSLTETTYGFDEKTDYFNWTAKVFYGDDQGIFWLGSIKNETDGGFQGGTTSISSLQADYGQFEGCRFLANHMIQTNVSEQPNGVNLSAMQWFSYPMEHQYNFTQVRLYFDIGDEHFSSPFNYWDYDHPVNVTSDHIVVAELVDNGYGSTTGNIIPYWDTSGADFDPDSSEWATASQERWNFPVVANLNATTAFTGTEAENSWIEIDITDLVNYWNENITIEKYRLGIRLRITKLGDPTNSSWLFIDNYGMEWTYLVPKVLSGSTNPYWFEVGETQKAEFDRFDNHFTWENGRLFREHQATYHYFGGKNFKGKAFNLADQSYELWGNLTDEGVNLTFAKISAVSPSWSFGYWEFEMQPETNPYVVGGEYRVRFRAEDHWSGNLMNSGLDITINDDDDTVGMSPSWGFSGAGSPSTVYNGEWHEIVFQLTPHGEFNDPNTVIHLLAYLDGEMIRNYDLDDIFDITDVSREDNWLRAMGAGQFTVKFGCTGGDNQGGGNNGDLVWLELDYMSFTPYLDYRLSNDSTTGSTSVESYSYVPTSNAQNETFLRLAQDLYDDSYADHNIELYVPLDEADEGLGAVAPIYAHDPYRSINSIGYSVTDWVNGQILGAADFEADNNDYINFGDHDDWTFATGGVDEPFSISAWVNQEDNSGDRVIISKYNSSSSTENEWNLFLLNGRLTLGLWTDLSNYIGQRADSGEAITTGQFYHVVAVYNGNESASGISLYVNGSLISSSPISGGTYTGMTNTITSVYVGDVVTPFAGSPFDGLIDHIKVYNQELTAVEVLTLYNSPLYNTVGFTNQDLTIDTTRMYNVDENGVYTEGHELLRLAFGNYFRRFEQVPKEANPYFYQSEGIDLTNYPIMTFDMKVNFESDYGNLGNINDSYSNAYITLYNESMYPIASSNWYNAENIGGTSYTLVRDLGFTVTENQWVSIRLDLRNLLEDYDSWSNSNLQATLQTSVLSNIGGIGFSFYWNNTLQQYYANPSDPFGFNRQMYNLSYLEYSVKIDNLQFLPIQTVGTYDYVEYANDITYFAPGGYTKADEYDIVKVGNSSIRLTSVGYDGLDWWYRWYDSGAPDVNVLTDDGYFLLWIYPVNNSLGFVTNQYHALQVYTQDGESLYPLFNYIMPNGEFYDGSTFDGHLWLKADQWHLLTIPTKSFIGKQDSDSSNGLVDDLRLTTIQEWEVNFIIDGFTYIAGNFDYSNLTLSDYNANWNQSYLINSTQNIDNIKGFKETHEFTEQRNSVLNDSLQVTYLDPEGTLGVKDSFDVDWDILYETEREGIEENLGYAWDFSNIDSALLANFNMDEGTGTVLYDSSGNGHNAGGFDTAHWITGFNGTGIDTDEFPTPEVATISDRDAFSFTDGSDNDEPFSIAVWVNVTDADDHVVVAKFDTPVDDEWILEINSTEAILFRLMDASQGWIRRETSNNAITPGYWSQIIITYSGNESAGGINIYVNGSDVDTASTTSGNYYGMENTDASVDIGGNSIADWGENVRIDELSFWTKELIPSEVSAFWSVTPEEIAVTGSNPLGFSFSDNVYSNASSGEGILLDALTEFDAGDPRVVDYTWMAHDCDDIQIDWLYWNFMLVKVRNLETTNVISLATTDRSSVTTTGDYNNGWITTWFYIWNVNEKYGYNEKNVAMDNSTFIFHWYGGSGSGVSYTGDMEIAWIKLYHIEGQSGYLRNNYYGESTGNYGFNVHGILPGDPETYDIYSWDNDSSNVLMGETSWKMEINHWNDTLAFATLDDSEFVFSNARGDGRAEYSSTSGSYLRRHYGYYDWSNTTALEFWLKSNETLKGAGAESGLLQGQMWIYIGTIDVEGNAGDRGYNNITFDHIVNDPLGSYNGTLGADYWYHFVIPFDDYDYETGTWDLSRVDSFRMMFVNGLESDTMGFFSADGNYTMWLDGFRPFNLTMSLMNTSTFYDGIYDSLSLIDEYTGAFDFNSNSKILLNHELKYILERSPVVSSYTGYLTNGSNQVVYELNYTIQQQNDTQLFDYVHKFYYPKSYSFYNVTFGNGTTKTIQSGFTITSFNSSHYLVEVTAWENGTWEWNFITENSVVYFNISPRIEDGLQYNVTEIYYNASLMNGSTALIGYPVVIEVKAPEDVVLSNDTKTSGIGGWINSSISGSWDMQTDKEIYVSVRCTNQSFLGYEVEYLLAYQDFDAPEITAIEFDEITDPNLPKEFFVWTTDTWTDTADITVEMLYSFISSGSLTESTFGSLAAGKFEISVAGQSADTTVWFKFIVTDNMSNSFETGVYEAEWAEPAPPTGDGDGDGDGVAPPAVAPRPAGIGTEWLILLFALGAVFAAVLVIGIYRRVVVRTRRVEEREVITVFGRTGRAKERVEEKRG